MSESSENLIELLKLLSETNPILGPQLLKLCAQKEWAEKNYKYNNVWKEVFKENECQQPMN